ncbi:MAG: glycosyltransferase [Patescibacteria group bacterium]|nr:glycosyltransferase [Patescibacteria group bacterium]
MRNKSNNGKGEIIKELPHLEEERRVRLVGFLKVYNELASGNLPRVLRHLKNVCDEIVVCDCSSSDGSYEIIKQYTPHILREPNDFKREIFAKQKMLEYILKLNPDWIVWLDADEVFERSGEEGGLKRLCAYGDRNGFDGFEFQEVNLWKGTREYRTDGFWGKGWFVRLWKNNGNLSFDAETGLHKDQHPRGLDNIAKSELKVIHYGFSSAEEIGKKYERYKRNGQKGFYLEMFKDEKNIRLETLDVDLLPLSALKISVVSLIYKSVPYIKFVSDSFNKHTENAEFVFVANDATDKVKNYLKENGVVHLVLENEDKNEYYLNRVYRAWNYGGMNAPGDIIVFVNSDMAFSDGWLDNLLKWLRKDRIVCSRLVESGKMPSGTYGISRNFGQSYKEYNDTGFQEFAKRTSKPELREGGLFMPCAIYKESFIKSGGYPIGNRKIPDGKEISGDHIFFYETLKPMGINHFTAFDSIVYHIQEGEMDE